MLEFAQIVSAWVIQQMLINPRLSYPVASYAGSSMSHGRHMESDILFAKRSSIATFRVLHHERRHQREQHRNLFKQVTLNRGRPCQARARPRNPGSSRTGSGRPAPPMYTESSRFSICSYILTPYGCWPLLIFAVVPFGRYPSVELRRYASRHRNVSGLRRVFTDGPRQLG